MYRKFLKSSSSTCSCTQCPLIFSVESVGVKLYFIHIFFRMAILCISQFQLCPTPPGISIFLALSCQIPRGGDEKRGKTPRSPSNPSGSGQKKRENAQSSVNTATFFIDRTVKYSLPRRRF